MIPYQRQQRRLIRRHTRYSTASSRERVVIRCKQRISSVESAPSAAPKVALVPLPLNPGMIIEAIPASELSEVVRRVAEYGCDILWRGEHAGGVDDQDVER